MDDKKEIKTIETMPGFKPLQIIQWSSGYGCDIKCDNVLIGIVDENFRDQYRAHMQDHFCVQIGRCWSYEYFEKHDDGVRFIRDKWVLFLQQLIEENKPTEQSTPDPNHSFLCRCIECVREYDV